MLVMVQHRSYVHVSAQNGLSDQIIGWNKGLDAGLGHPRSPMKAQGYFLTSYFSHVTKLCMFKMCYYTFHVNL